MENRLPVDGVIDGRSVVKYAFGTALVLPDLPSSDLPTPE